MYSGVIPSIIVRPSPTKPVLGRSSPSTTGTEITAVGRHALSKSERSVYARELCAAWIFQSCRSYIPPSDVGRAAFLWCGGKAWFDSPLSNDWREWLGVKAIYLPRCLWRGLLCGLSYAGRRSFKMWPLLLLLFSAPKRAVLDERDFQHWASQSHSIISKR